MLESPLCVFSDVLDQWSEKQPDRLAFRFLDENEEESALVTYSALRQSAVRIARLLSVHAERRDRALLVFDTGPHFFESLFGCMYADVVGVPVDPPHGRRAWGGIHKIAADCRPAVILTTGPLQKRWGENLSRLAEEAASRVVVIDGEEEGLNAPLPSDVDPSLPALLQYTSGSTGVPKGVMVTHHNIMKHLPPLRRALRVDHDSEIVSWLPLFHDLGLVACALQPLHAGITTTLMAPTTFVRKPVRWLRAMTRYRATMTAGPDFAYRLCAEKVSDEELEGLDLSAWDVALNGAERVSALTVDRFQERFGPVGFRARTMHPSYGMAEATLMLSTRVGSEPIRTVEVPEQQVFAYAAPVEGNEAKIEAVSCGRPQPEIELRIADPADLTERPEGQIGEVWARSEGVAAGYWQREKETRETFRAHLSDSGDGPFLRTGDLGFFDGGELFLIGRMKEVVIVRGRNYAAQDIEEAVFVSHPALRTGHIVALSLLRGDVETAAVAAEIDRSVWRTFDGDEVVSAIRESVMETFELALGQISLLRPGALPKTTSGKLRRLESRRMLAAAEWKPLFEWSSAERVAAEEDGAEGLEFPDLADRDFDQRVDDILLWLRRRLARANGVEESAVAEEEPFSRYGLDSHLAAEIAVELENGLGTEAPPTVFWEYPDPLALAEFLAGRDAVRA